MLQCDNLVLTVFFQKSVCYPQINANEEFRKFTINPITETKGVVHSKLYTTLQYYTHH